MPPLLFAWVQLSKRGQAGDDETNVSDASDEHHERVRSGYTPGTKKSPKLVRSGLYQVGAEPLEAVPRDGDRDAGAKSQCAVSAREKDNSNVDQCLKRVQQTEPRNNDRRSHQRKNEEPGSERDPSACPLGSVAVLRCQARFNGTDLDRSHDLVVLKFRRHVSERMIAIFKL